ncbi:Cof-type HAD-IIB family hydrolase [Actinomyces sp. zg-332]|uniref:Cof-type HAD-IIB family hydrolase n=1 Tax=Actinomyces sp. zg-332 TaxID=2708340 RepID=UPI0018C2AF0F|nr:Cof-type HAD-IIB family hydrolase [Actinomyces sp. zg-332]QPK94071.1 Cof-type HAD-IIB family hydrolase [Actinomyces sp. zg-332]
MNRWTYERMDCMRMNFEELVKEQEKFIPDNLAKDLSKTLVGVDVDGTMINASNEISEQMKSSLRRLIENGAIFSIASGRGVMSVKSALEKAGVDKCYAVCSNGGVVAQFNPEFEDGYKILTRTNFIFKNAIEKLYEKIPNAHFCLENVGKGFYMDKLFPENKMIGEQTLKTIDEIKNMPAPRLVVTVPEYTNAQLREIVDSIDLEDVEYSFGRTAWMDLTPKNMTKKVGLEQLATLLGVNPENTLTIGDGDNDITMFEWSGHSVAMGDGYYKAKESAKVVTADVYNDGCAAVFEALVNKALANSL